MKAPAIVTLLPTAPFLLELHSERMVDALLALNEAGFKVNAVPNTLNRFRITEESDNVPFQEG